MRSLACSALVALLAWMPVHEPDGHWSTAKPLPEPLQEIHAAAINGKIYVAGGIDRDDKPTAHAYCYDPATDSWTRIADLPAPRHHMLIVALHDTLYALGGFSGTTFHAERAVWAYVPALNTWLTRAELPAPRGAAAAAVVNGKIVVVGGLSRIADGGMAFQTVIYDPAFNAWLQVSPIPTMRDHLTAETVQDTLYAIGGRYLSPERNFATVEDYDIRRDRWYSKSPMPVKLGALGSAVLDGKIHVFGGEDRSSTFTAHEVYDPATDTWTDAPPLPTARHGAAVAVADGKIYVIGGGPRPGFTQTDVVEVYTP